MYWFQNRKIATKMIIGFILIALISTIVGTIGVKNIHEIEKADTELFEENLIPIELLGDMTQAFQRVRVHIYAAILASTEKEKAIQLQKINDRRAEFGEAYEAFGSIPMTPEIQQVYDELIEARKAYAEMFNAAMVLIEEGRTEEAIELTREDGDFGKVSGAEQEIIAKLVDIKTEEAKQKSDNNTKTADTATVTMIGIIIGGLIISIVLGIILSKIISRPIIFLKDASNKLALGDTDVNIVQKSKDEIGELMGAFSKMASNIEEQAENAQRIAAGDLSVEIIPKSDKDILGESINKMVQAIRSTFSELEASITNIELGHFREKSTMDNNLEGGWKDIILGINRMLDIFVVYLDSLPIVIMTIDKDFNIKYLNQTGTQILGFSENEKVDNKCYSCFNTTDCRTEQCACNRAMKEGKKVSNETTAQIGDNTMHISYTGIPIVNKNGDVTGAFEVVMDQTQIKAAQIISEKQSEYQKQEVEKLIVNLDKLANGQLEIKTSVSQSDQDTEEIANNFMEINDNLEKTTSIIKSYISELSEVLGKMANKNLDVGINREYLGDFKEIKDSINYIVEQLNSVLTEINASAEQVETGVDQVAASSQNLSQGASEQAGSVEEIGATVTQVAQQTQENAQNANKANDLSMKVKVDAQQGNEQMSEMLSAMDEIKDSSKNIANIIKVIDEIAFQTNILALNAAVEAARAGEHGKGFAVVAEEVRNLAARSAKAAKETTEMIDNSINKVEEGYTIANDTADALNNIVTGVTDAVEIVGTIANASSEQASAISEINQGIEQISQVTQSNTATAEESASASEEMAGQAQMLKGLIQEFKLKNLAGELSENTQIVKRQKLSDRIEESDIQISLDHDNFGKY